jgi:hypothetical protein
MAALPTLATRQSAGDFAAVLKDVEMPPGELFTMVIAKHFPSVLRTTD